MLLTIGVATGGPALQWLWQQQTQARGERPQPLPQDPLIQVYMNHNLAATYTEPYRQIQRSGDDLEQIMVDAIAPATTTVEVAVQELRLPKIAQALIDRHRAGVKIRVIIENTYARPFSAFTPQELAELPERDQDRIKEGWTLIDLNGDGSLSPEEINQRDALVMLKTAGVPLIDDTEDGSKGIDLMHHKFIVVDGQRLIVTSANFTTSDVHGDFAVPSNRGNANSLLRIESPELAQLFTQEFNLMWGDGPGGQSDSLFGNKKPHRPPQTLTIGTTPLTVKFSPDAKSIPWEETSNGLIAKTLNQASQSTDLALFVFSEQRLANILHTTHQQGVTIRALIDPAFAYPYYSEALDLLGVALLKQEGKGGCFFEVDNQPWQPPITSVGVPRLPPGDKLHHKYGVVDQQRVIVGSHNWSAAANNGNDETLMVVDSPTIAAHYHREFERLYTDAFLGVPPAIQRKIEQQRQQCPQAVNATAKDSPTATTPVPKRSPKPKIPGLLSSEDIATMAAASESAPQPGSPAKPKASRRSPASPQGELTPGQVVNLNTASAAEIEALPGVGPKLAQRIIDARQQHPFASLADLDQVPGVGAKLLEKLRDRVTW
ncbi:phospholipase D-like domain-containing protein [Neosynechococcus sphagnicola]|nr:phospholipase D-like domain-containing protein [Neosynechococcus sphagnicola]